MNTSNEMNMTTMSGFDDPLSDTQYFVLWGIASVGCAFTWFGTISILYIARRKLNSIYHRLLFVISWVELLANFLGFFSPIMMDKSTGYPLAHGNQATCTTIGVVLLFSVISKAFSSCYISMYFMLTIRYNWKDEKIRAYEKFAYLVAFSVPVSYSVVGLVNDFFNPNASRLCAISEYPSGCKGDECIRGEFAAILSTVCTLTSIVICIVAITCTVLLFLSVRKQAKQSARHSFAGSINEGTMKRMKLVRTQTILYVTVFLNNFVWLMLFNAFVFVGINVAIFASGIMVFVFMPSYGFFVFCIYCYPRYVRIKEHFPDKSLFWRVKLLYTKDEGDGEIAARRRGRSSQIILGKIEMAGSQSHLASKALESGDIVLDEPAKTSSFHGSGDTSFDHEAQPMDGDKDDGALSNNDIAISDEFVNEMETDKNLYVEH